MSLSSALSNALSGLNAASRSAQITASNLANVMTEGYGRREIALSARGHGSHGGVTVDGITRNTDPVLIGERRLALSEQAGNTWLADYYSRLEALAGTPDDGASLSARLSDFEASLVAAASRPDLSGRLDQLLSDAEAVAATF